MVNKIAASLSMAVALAGSLAVITSDEDATSVHFVWIAFMFFTAFINFLSIKKDE